MKVVNITYQFILASLLVTTFSCKQSDPVNKKTSLVWSDEFNANELNTSKWEVQEGDGSQYGLWGWGNGEKQYYQEKNLKVENGLLKITARSEEVNGYEYTSGRIRSLNKGDFKYGRMEASIRMQPVGGTWYAFWMLPSNPPESWPVSGEIDIMEYVGKTPNEILNYVHFADLVGNHQFIGDFTLIEPDNQFHEYAVEWDENQIIWYRDSVETYSVLRTNDRLKDTWPFDAKFHLILNLAIGGNLGGNEAIEKDKLANGVVMEVDYVRVYQ